MEKRKGCTCFVRPFFEKTISMKVTKNLYDLFGIGMPIMFNLLIASLFVTFSQVDDSGLTYYAYTITYIFIIIVQAYSSPVKMFKKVKRYHADNEQAYPNNFFTNPFLAFLPFLLLIIMRWKFPSSSEPLIWIVSIIGIMFLLYLVRNFFSNKFEENEPYYLLIDSKEHLTFFQRNFSVKFEKEQIRQMLIKPQEKIITIDIGKKVVLKMPFHLRPTLELMRLDFSDQYPHWFIEN